MPLLGNAVSFSYSKILVFSDFGLLFNILHYDYEILKPNHQSLSQQILSDVFLYEIFI
jgi:hypothetical protein